MRYENLKWFTRMVAQIIFEQKTVPNRTIFADAPTYA